MSKSTPKHPPTRTNVPIYRSYWPFAAIYLLLPPLVGLIILLTGDIYRKQPDGHTQPITSREKLTLTVVMILLWGFFIYSRLSSI